ncbi:hypothetical protein [Acetonema longum]|uniref:Uncharacterized protein n=1 Tax=Acetonema longum DSM 6540 TaxID=1009370 RepID=F7NKA7_9FIRM|nr:hypothetical protein [Acetonema longum]EGO63548.1 hypothetical protein ALO_12601 [Acetonema longum DSM 6540]
MPKTGFICVCGEPMRYIHGDDGCGDIRCIACLRSSGYCGSISEAMREYERINGKNPLEAVKDDA